MAGAVTERYPTPALLWQAYKQAQQRAAGLGQDPELAARAMLMGVECQHGRRKVTQLESSKIFDHLFAS